MENYVESILTFLGVVFTLTIAPVINDWRKERQKRAAEKKKSMDTVKALIRRVEQLEREANGRQEVNGRPVVYHKGRIRRVSR